MKKGILALITCTLLFSCYALIQYTKTNADFVKFETEFSSTADSLQNAFLLPSKKAIIQRLSFLFESKMELGAMNKKVLNKENILRYEDLKRNIKGQIVEIKTLPQQTDFYVLNSAYKSATDKEAFLKRMKSFYPTAKNILKIKDASGIDKLISKQKDLYHQVKKDPELQGQNLLKQEVLIQIKDFVAFLRSEKITLLN